MCRLHSFHEPQLGVRDDVLEDLRHVGLVGGRIVPAAGSIAAAVGSPADAGQVVEKVGRVSIRACVADARRIDTKVVALHDGSLHQARLLLIRVAARDGPIVDGLAGAGISPGIGVRVDVVADRGVRALLEVGLAVGQEDDDLVGVFASRTPPWLCGLMWLYARARPASVSVLRPLSLHAWSCVQAVITVL